MDVLPAPIYTTSISILRGQKKVSWKSSEDGFKLSLASYLILTYHISVPGLVRSPVVARVSDSCNVVNLTRLSFLWTVVCSPVECGLSAVSHCEAHGKYSQHICSHLFLGDRQGRTPQGACGFSVTPHRNFLNGAGESLSTSLTLFCFVLRLEVRHRLPLAPLSCL